MKSGTAFVSKRSVLVEWSGIRTISSLVRESGHGAISLGIGQPDFSTPGHIIEAAKRALEEGYTRYPPAKGFEDLRIAISKKLSSKNGIQADPDRNIFVSIGAMQGIFNSVLHLIDTGDEVIVVDPGYDYYSQIRLFGGVPVRVAARESNAFKVDPSDIRKAVTARTKLILLNSPSNPTGAMIDKEALLEISRLAQEHHIFVLSDEAYEDIVFEKPHFSIGSIEGMKDLTISVFTLSKTYAMTGWRIGYVVANPAIIDEMEKLMEHMASGVTAVSQRAALAALEGPQGCVTEMVNEYKKRRKLIFEGLNEIDGISCLEPEATFYAFPNIAKVSLDSWQFARHLIKSQKVGTVPGVVFGMNGESHLRISFASSEENISEGLQRIRKGVAEIGPCKNEL
jgi:aspartate/methionine/tyrosine aminotransferase